MEGIVWCYFPHLLENEELSQGLAHTAGSLPSSDLGSRLGGQRQMYFSGSGQNVWGSPATVPATFYTCVQNWTPALREERVSTDPAVDFNGSTCMSHTNVQGVLHSHPLSPVTNSLCIPKSQGTGSWREWQLTNLNDSWLTWTALELQQNLNLGW